MSERTTDTRTWPENAKPTPEQFAAWYVTQPREKQVEVAETLLDAMDRADWCFVRGHEQPAPFPEATP